MVTFLSRSISAALISVIIYVFCSDMKIFDFDETNCVRFVALMFDLTLSWLLVLLALLNVIFSQNCVMECVCDIDHGFRLDLIIR